MTFDTFTHAVEIVLLVFLFSGVCAVATGMYLRERAADFRLSYEQPFKQNCHVRLLEDDEQ